jgi:hypoxanthine-guanine phosphoribosyltransferase
VGLLGIGGWYADTFLGLDKDMNGTLSKQELQGYAEGTLTDIFIERGMFISCLTILKGSCIFMASLCKVLAGVVI